MALIAIYGVYVLFVKKEHKFGCLKYTLAPVFIIVIFAYSYVLGMLNGADMALARQFLLATGMFALIYPINEFEIDMNALLKTVAKIYIIFFTIYVIYAINIKEYNIPAFIIKIANLLDNGITRGIGSTLKELGSGLIKHRSFFGGKGIQVYLGSTPFLLVLMDILYIDFLKNKKKSNLIWVALVAVLTLATASRTLMLLVPATICLLTVLRLEPKYRRIAMCLLVVAGIAVFFYLLNNSRFFGLKEGSSNYVKVGHFFSYFEQLNWKNAILGNGLATFYYTWGEGCELAHTEITFIDHCRWFGIPFSILVWASLVVPKIKANWKNWKTWKVWEVKEELVVLLLYLFFAQTNPVLFNSFGLISVLWYWNVLFLRDKKGKCV